MKALFGIDLFATPEALFLLLLLPVYLWWYLRYYARQRLVIRMSYDPSQLKKPDVDLTLLRFIPRALQAASVCLIIIALARPQSATEIVERQSEGIDIMLLLDTSSSMEETDFPPNRLEVAKSTAISFIDGRKDDRIGMVLFAADAYSYAPLTLDYDLIRKMIQAIQFNILPRQGTAIGSAISVGINRMRDSETSSKIMILMTDGANNRGQISPITAAELAQTFNIRIYCIGIGNTTVKASSRNPRNIPGLDEKSLTQITQMTGGTYFHASNPESLTSIFKQISKLETVDIHDEVFREITDHYPKFLKIAIVFLIISFILMLTSVYNPLEQ